MRQRRSRAAADRHLAGPGASHEDGRPLQGPAQAHLLGHGGYSYGAWCAASLAMRHPNVYGAAVVLQGYFRPDFSAAYDPLSTDGLRNYDLVALARNAPPPLAMWVLTSRDDSLSYPTTSKFLSVARPPLDVTATVLAHGGHRLDVFTPYVPNALTWLAQTLPGFRA